MKRKGSLLGLFIIYFALIAGAIILIVWPQYVTFI